MALKALKTEIERRSLGRTIQLGQKEGAILKYLCGDTFIQFKIWTATRSANLGHRGLFVCIELIDILGACVAETVVLLVIHH